MNLPPVPVSRLGDFEAQTRLFNSRVMLKSISL